MSSELRKLWEHAGGQLPDDWAMVSLESLLRDSKSIAVGVMYPGPDTPGGVPLLKVGDVKDGSVPIKPSYRISAETDEEHKRTKLVGDELLITLVGNPGECIVVTQEMAGWNPARAIAVVRLHDTSLRTYLKTVLESTAGRHLIDAVLNTTVQKTLNLKDIRRLPIPLPSSATIKSISSFSEALTMRITLLREANTTLEAMAQALFKSWFVDFDPVRAKAQGLEPEGMDTATAALFPDSFEESELGLVPSGWLVDRASSWLSVLETGRRPKGGVAGIMDGVPSIGAESIVRIGEFDYSKTKYVSSEFFEKMKSGELQSHDVLLYKDGGKPGVFLPRVSMFGNGFPFKKCGINEHVFRIRLKEPFSQAFLYYWLWSDAVMHELKHRGGKAAIPGINQSDVKELKLLVPNEQILISFDELCSPLIDKIFSNSKQARTLTQLRDTLLPRLISGQLRLPEAEVMVEEVCA